jgi:hypothetical protein
MEPIELPFLPGNPLPALSPLSRYLPPIPAGVAQPWLAGHIPPGAWILDPFGASPQLILDAARQGYRVLVTANNPILGFILEVMASAPQVDDLQAALADLAAARKGEERLELHIQSLYTTECVVCKNVLQAKAFYWLKDAQVPTSCLVECPHCGDSGERPVPTANLERLAALGKGVLHRSRALERVVPLGDPIRPHVEQALNCYQLRPLYALFTILNRLEGLGLTPDRQKLAYALLLSACDEANTLWPHPTSRHRPRQLVVPPGFLENNLWLALENAVEEWQAAGPPVPLTLWPDLPPAGGGICLFKGRLKDLAPDLPPLDLQAVLTVLPRPNQAFWTLSAVWAGWLWGREAVAPLRSALTRQRYDWGWHTAALESTLTSLQPSLKPGTPCLGLIAEAEYPFLLAAIIAAENAAFQLDGFALREDPPEFQAYWHPRSPGTPPDLSPPQPAWKVIQAHLLSRNEPAPFLPLYLLSTLAYLFQKRYDRQPLLSLEGLSPFGQTQEAVLQHLTGEERLTRFGGSPQSPDRSYWWLSASSPQSPTLADRVEMSLVRGLLRSPGRTLAEIDEDLCKEYKGVFTPNLDLIEACLKSYAEKDPGKEAVWTLRAEDTPASRRADLKQLPLILKEIGRQLAYQVTGENPLQWLNSDGSLAYAFYLLASGIVSRYVSAPSFSPAKSILLLPGSRANLVTYKLHHDPFLNQEITKGWRVLKYRQVRQITGSLFLDRVAWEEILKTDPMID